MSLTTSNGVSSTLFSALGWEQETGNTFCIVSMNILAPLLEEKEAKEDEESYRWSPDLVESARSCDLEKRPKDLERWATILQYASRSPSFFFFGHLPLGALLSYGICLLQQPVCARHTAIKP
jgi:hypothetical protein